MARYYLPKALTYNLISPDYPAANLATLKAALIAGINAEADWTENSAAGPLIRWFEYSHGNVGAGKAWALTQANALKPGKPSPFFEALDNATQDGAVLVRGNGASTDLAYVEGDIDLEWQEPGRIALVVLAGGEVQGVTVWFELDDPDAVCPLGNGTEQWDEWMEGGANSEPVRKGDKWYRSSSNYNNGGSPLLASQWVAYYLGGGQVLSTLAYQAIVDDSEPPGP